MKIDKCEYEVTYDTTNGGEKHDMETSDCQENGTTRLTTRVLDNETRPRLNFPRPRLKLQISGPSFSNSQQVQMKTYTNFENEIYECVCMYT